MEMANNFISVDDRDERFAPQFYRMMKKITHNAILYLEIPNRTHLKRHIYTEK